MKRLCAVLGVIAVSAVAVVSVAGADQPPAKTVTAVLSADKVVPRCAAATNAAGGNAVFHIDQFGGVDYKVVAHNLPGDLKQVLLWKHVTGPFPDFPVLKLDIAPFKPGGNENGVVANGSLGGGMPLADIRGNPQNYYVQVSTSLCPAGAIRGQLDEHGPLNN
jgi:CHRD domain